MLASAFTRVIYENWTGIIVIGSFAVVACAFLIATVRALCMPKAKREHLENLPLEGTEEQAPPPPSTEDASSLPTKP